MLRLAREVWPRTLAQLRACGQGRRECVVYWVGPLADGERVDLVVHPEHSARPGRYQIADRWLTPFWVCLAEEERSVRAQVHTHAGLAGHSRTDDEWALIQTAGFLSLVLPDFAMGPLDPTTVYVARLERGGRWSRMPFADAVREG